jgi:hypothetical protein
VSLGPHLVVVSETDIEERILLALGHLFKFFVGIAKAYEFHGFPPDSAVVVPVRSSRETRKIDRRREQNFILSAP